MHKAVKSSLTALFEIRLPKKYGRSDMRKNTYIRYRRFAIVAKEYLRLIMMILLIIIVAKNI
ncbi:MAG: hypothetical protein ACK41T_11075 [Pseudobdellovibrio sp.]